MVSAYHYIIGGYVKTNDEKDRISTTEYFEVGEDIIESPHLLPSEVDVSKLNQEQNLLNAYLENWFDSICLQPNSAHFYKTRVSVQFGSLVWMDKSKRRRK